MSQQNTNIGLFQDMTGHTIDEYPSEVDGQFLLGLKDDGAWYYSPSDNSVHNYTISEESSNEFAQLNKAFSMTGYEFEDSYDGVYELCDELIDKTEIGHAFILSQQLTEETHLTENRAKAFAFRTVYSVPRIKTSQVLDKAPNTVDAQKAQAKRDAKKARNFIRIITDYNSVNVESL